MAQAAPWIVRDGSIDGLAPVVPSPDRQSWHNEVGTRIPDTAMARITCLLLLLVIAPTLHADIWRWVDEDGVTQYAQNPPPGVDAERVQPGMGIAPDPDPAATTADAEGADDAATAEANDEPRTMEEFCATIEEQLALLDSGQDVRVEGEDGQLQPLEGEARERRRAALQQQFDRHC